MPPPPLHSHFYYLLILIFRSATLLLLPTFYFISISLPRPQVDFAADLHWPFVNAGLHGLHYFRLPFLLAIAFYAFSGQPMTTHFNGNNNASAMTNCSFRFHFLFWAGSHILLFTLFWIISFRYDRRIFTRRILTWFTGRRYQFSCHLHKTMPRNTLSFLMIWSRFQPLLAKFQLQREIRTVVLRNIIYLSDTLLAITANNLSL